MHGILALALASLLLLAGCSAGLAEPVQPAPDPVATTPKAPVADRDRAASSPDASCRTDADCEVKNVGNCCGYFPACVNRDAKVDPEAVKAECARTGTASICGFAEISACTCDAGQCRAVPGGGGERLD